MDNAEKIFSDIVSQGLLLIRQMVSDNREENIFIDFKEKSDNTNNHTGIDDKKNYAKALSGFSNSSGGVLIWGIRAHKTDESAPDVACEEIPISNLKRFLTDLNSYIGNATQPLNNRVQNLPVYINDEKDDIGFIVTYVPESNLAPVRALLGLNQYFIRVGDSFRIMEHYMLSDMFGKRQKPKLKIRYLITKGGLRNSFNIIISIENNGRYIATYPALRIKANCNLVLDGNGIDGNNGWNLCLRRQSIFEIREKGYLFTGGINDVIHPDTNLDVAIFRPKEYKIEIEELMRSNFKFSFVIYAEGCIAYSDTLEISSGEIRSVLDS